MMRIALLAVALLALQAGPAAMAHEDHEQLGAGPGPAAALDRQRSQPGSARVPQGPTSSSNRDMEMGGHMDAMGHGREQTDTPKTFGQRLVSWLGRLHTMVVHFPIAMIIGAFGVEVFGLARRSRNYQHVAYLMLIVGAIGSIVAAFLGWFAGGFYMTDRNVILMTHRWLGTGIAGFSLILVFMAAVSRRTPDRSRTLLLVLLGLAVMAISIQGFLGGTFMHGGLRHLAF
jgi:uncharacterized membrane protein